uniref:hypothetical protein n=1 Tax=uncultured Dysgonomonas sp. TaxID=206096 RepID=UPI0026100968|nr:hypothetical protein [uncultured Dysgonomonas sp.]
MTTVKKIILFLFGIVLIVFGNKAAIDTMFKNNEEPKTPNLGEQDITDKNPVITEEIDADIKSQDTVISPLKTSEAENITTKVTNETEKPKKEKSVKSKEKKEESKLKETPKTKIEPVKEETAAASE